MPKQTASRLNRLSEITQKEHADLSNAKEKTRTGWMISGTGILKILCGLVIALLLTTNVSGCSTPSVKYQPIDETYLIPCVLPEHESWEDIPKTIPEMNTEYVQIFLCAKRGNDDKAAIKAKYE